MPEPEPKDSDVALKMAEIQQAEAEADNTHKRVAEGQKRFIQYNCTSVALGMSRYPWVSLRMQDKERYSACDFKHNLMEHWASRTRPECSFRQ